MFFNNLFFGHLWKSHLPSGDGEAMSSFMTNLDTGASTNGCASLCWFAAYTASHHEKRVSEQLTLRNVDSFLPQYKTRRQWKKKPPIILDLPLFPNYVFVRTSREELRIVLQTPGVYSIVGSGQKVWELPGQEIEALKLGLEERRIEPHPYLVVGERATVISGVLAGLEGVILRKKSSLQIVLSLDQLMQSVVIEVDASELAPLPHRAPSSSLCRT
jgi:transcription antitermination factor NusG